MSLLKDKLSQLREKELLVVMIDGRGFKGRLTEFDEETIILKDVIETSTKELRWRVPTIALPHSEEVIRKQMGGIIVGDTGSTLVKLNEVVIRINNIVRIWVWAPEEIKELEVEQY